MKTILKSRILTVPNLLSGIRILLIPLFIWLYLGKQDISATVAVLVLSGITDGLDGFIARRFDMVSDFGKALDPFADKLTQFAMLCCLVIHFPKMRWLILVLCVKEVIAACTQLAVIHKTKVVLGSDWHGKATTVLLYAVMILHLVWMDMPDQLSWALVLLCMGMLILSGILYGIRNIRAVRSASEPSTAEPKEKETPKT